MIKFYIFISKLFLFLFNTLNIKKKFVSKINFSLGLNNILCLEKNYKNTNSLHQVECKVFSQNGEDGIIDYIISNLNISRPNFIEIGVESYIEANTRFIYERFYPKGLIIDCEKNLKNKVYSNVNPWKGDLRVVEEKVSTLNINNLISKNCDFNIDIFSLDIDSIDYWVIECLKPNISKVFIAEYNAVFGSEFEITVPNLENFEKKEYHYSQLCFGTSLMALIKIMKKKGFYFIGTNSVRSNAFFISNDYPKDKFFSNLKIENISYYTDSNIRESRDKDNNLNYLSGSLKLEEIKNCEVIDLSSESKELKKIKNLI